MVSQLAKVWHVVSPGTPEHRNTGIPRNTEHPGTPGTVPENPGHPGTPFRKPGISRNNFQKTRNTPEHLSENPEHLIDNPEHLTENQK